MTNRKIEETLGLPALDDLISNLPENIDEDDNAELAEALLEFSESSLPTIDDGGHGKAMRNLYDESLKQGKDLIDLGFNIEPARSARMFEVAGNYLKIALDAMNSKRDFQLKTLQMLREQRKLELEEKRIKHEIGDTSGAIEADSFIVEDRNELIRRMREQVKSEK